LEQAVRRVTIADVAEAAGVSKTTVSFAFNNPERLNVETAVRIRAVATSLGYRPDPVARMLASGRTGVVGVLTPQALAVIFTNPYFATFIAGVATAAEASGYALQFISPVDGSLVRAVDRASVDGVVAIGLTADHPEIAEVRRAGLPFVTVDAAPLADQPSIDVDDEGGARSAAEHLLGLGHRDILVIGIEPPEHADGMDPDGVTARRLRGYRSALEPAGVDCPDEALVVGPASILGGIAAVQAAWDDGRRPTAILAMSDAMGIGAMRAVRDLGLAVPTDISVVGFDDIDLAQYTDPPLTTVHQPVARKGEESVRLLLGALGRGPATAVHHQRLDTRLVVRASTGPPRSADGQP
jgi:DNA-binding LacI/PurR family transcriptional regulator